MKKLHILYTLLVSALVMTSCKTPQATKMTDNVKLQLPSKFQKDSVAGTSATVTP